MEDGGWKMEDGDEMNKNVITESTGAAQIQHGRSGGVKRMLVTESAPRGIFTFAGSATWCSTSTSASTSSASAASSTATVDL